MCRVSEVLGLTDAAKTREAFVLQGAGEDTICVLESSAVPDNGQLGTRHAEATLIAANMLDKVEDTRSYVKNLFAACRKAVGEVEKNGTGEYADALLEALSDLDAKLVSQDIESVGDVVDLMTKAASLI
ncbi:unnamed protein product, partial [Ectocarpus sp. 8 AP-2014]